MSSDFSDRAVAQIDLDAFANNIEVVRNACPEQAYLPIIKANGYGHGLEAIAGALVANASQTDQSATTLEGCAIAALSEAQRLREWGWDRPIVLLPGFINAAELDECRRLKVDPVIHSPHQLALLRGNAGGISRVWLKANTGMNRLGLNTEACAKSRCRCNVASCLRRRARLAGNHEAEIAVRFAACGCGGY